jgi:hypothetical protein
MRTGICFSVLIAAVASATLAEEPPPINDPFNNLDDWQVEGNVAVQSVVANDDNGVNTSAILDDLSRGCDLQGKWRLCLLIPRIRQVFRP